MTEDTGAGGGMTLNAERRVDEMGSRIFPRAGSSVDLRRFEHLASFRGGVFSDVCWAEPPNFAVMGFFPRAGGALP
jgi:hypothetical protein